MQRNKKRIVAFASFLASALIFAASILAAALSSGAPEIVLSYQKISYDGSAIHAKYAVAVTDLPEGATVGLDVRKASPTTAAIFATYEGIEEIEGKEHHVFAFDEILPSEMTANLYISPYVRFSDGSFLGGEVKKTSVLEYAYKALGKTGEPAAVSGEAADAVNSMLTAGAEAQRSDGVLTNRLATDSYVLLRAVDGAFEDGFTKELVKLGESIEITANDREGTFAIGWRNSAGKRVGDLSTLTVIAKSNDTFSVIYGGVSRTISYDAMGGTLPTGLPSGYVEGKETYSLADPVRAGYRFGGWYTSSDFRADSCVTSIHEDLRGDMTLYAKWCKIISSLDGDVIYQKGKQTLNQTSDTGSVKNGFSVIDKTLVWSQGDSIRSQMAMNGNLYAGTEGELAVTIEFTMAATEGRKTVPGEFRIRRANAGFVSVVNAITIKTDGSVLLGGQTGYKIATLTSKMQTIRVVVDFKEKTMVAYGSDGHAILVYHFPLPSKEDPSLTYEEWFSNVTSVLWQFYSEHTAEGAELNIANITVIAGNSAARGVTDITLTGREKLEDLLLRVDEQRDKITEGKLFGESTADINMAGGESKKNKWGEAPYAPIDTHPRLYINSGGVADVRASIEATDETTKLRFKSFLNIELDDECILPPPEYKGTNATVDIDNIHNFNASYLEIIQVKALGYLLYGNEYYGYQAIYYLKNFLDSLDIVQIGSDQCRQYGSVMNTAAIVYDWCYDLLTEEDKEQIIAGVENRICRYKNVMGSAMEVGFPPYGQSSVAGHGAERQILRDYLAFATAIYGDNDSWWDYIGARVWNDFAPTRNYYFQSGAIHQGTSYAVGRHVSDLFSDWIITTATGHSPYNEYIKTAAKGMLGYEYADGIIFNDGDGTGDGKATSGYMHVAFIAAYLYEDGELLKYAKDLLGAKTITSDHNQLTSVLYLALAGLSEVELAEDKYASMSLIQYNGHPLGQYIIREAWGVDDSAAVMMRIKERTTANHEHKDSGTFEIYYKGALTTDGGAYNNYGHFHTQQYHHATIAHNGLIIFNQQKWNYNSSTVATKWYSGGQKPTTSSNNFEALMGSVNDVAEITGRQHGYSDEEENHPLFAYIAGDITKAYYEDTVDYVGRRMLTVYTGNEDFPMAFFVYDDITSDKNLYEKRFLLQISSKDAPMVEGNVVTTENGGGRLVLTCLTDRVRIDAIGGRVTDENGKYSAKASSNYLINGYQCVPKSNTADDGHWGRVEIVATKLDRKATFMNVIYVTDAGQTKEAPPITRVKGGFVEGGTFGDVAAIFVTSRDRRSAGFSAEIQGSGMMNYYVSGVAAGEWQISVDGVSYGTATATEEGGLLTFRAPAGKLILISE